MLSEASGLGKWDIRDLCFPGHAFHAPEHWIRPAMPYYSGQSRTNSGPIQTCWFYAVDDAAAIRKAKERLTASGFARMELWQGGRKLGVVKRGK